MQNSASNALFFGPHQLERTRLAVATRRGELVVLAAAVPPELTQAALDLLRDLVSRATTRRAG